MNAPYPVVSERSLDPATRGGLFGLGRPRREWDDLPRARASEVLVYLVDGNHMLDSGRRALDDDAVVRATYVSVVDLTRDREVGVEFPIPSGDAKEFTVRVTFTCHVTDPVTVVKEGQGDAARALLGYVRSHQKLFRLGLNHKISQVDEVRLLVQTQIQAYAQYVPPHIPGMTVQLSHADVATPPDWAAHSGKVTTEEFEDERRRLQEQNARELDLLRRKYEMQLDEHEHMLRRQRQHGEHELTTNANDFDIWQMKNMDEATGGDPIRVAWLAQQRGEFTTAQVAEQLQAEADRLRQTQLRHETWERDDRVRAFTLRLDVYRELAQHGHLDEMGMQEIERSLERVLGQLDGNTKPASEKPDELQPPSSDGTEPEIPDELREEDFE